MIKGLKVLKLILNAPRHLIAHALNLLVAIPLTFVGLLARALAEWLLKDPQLIKQTEQEAITQAELDDAIEYLRLKLIEQEAEIERFEQEEINNDNELWEIEVELEEMEALGETNAKKSIH